MTEFDLAAARTILENRLPQWVRATALSAEAANADGVTLRLPYSKDIADADGIVSAQVLSVAADAAMTLAVLGASDASKSVRNVDLTANFMHPVRGADVLVTARIMRRGRSLVFVTAETAVAGRGEAIAFASGTYALV